MNLVLRIACFLACIPSGGALLLKVWGVMSMARAGLLFLGCLPVLVGGYLWARRHDEELARALRLGCWGGLLGTLGYDLVRVPFHLAGWRVFAPIEAYGVWLLDADRSSAWTQALGWLYHLSNGISFGIMYALWMGRRHWIWALLWGLSLEAIVLSTPFAHIFHLSGNVPAIVLAFSAHLAFGWPLGLVVRAWDRADSVPAATVFGVCLVVIVSVFGSVPEELARDGRAQPGRLRAESPRLNPSWLRLPSPGAVLIVNPSAQPVVLVEPGGRREVGVPPGERRELNFSRPGIYQCYLRTGAPSRSSFVIVEPVEGN